MKKIIVIVCLIIGTIGFKVFYDYKFILDRVEYQVYINGSSSASFPSKGNYSVQVACNNSKATWDYDNWKLSITNNTSTTDMCYIEFNSITNPDYLNQYIKDRVGTTQGASADAGQIVNENGYRYEGSNPNNYVMFNNELWRIIGVFDTEVAKSAGTFETQSLTKIIRNESIGGYAFDGHYNYWVNTSGERSSLNILLNDYYYNASSEGTSNEACKFYSTTVGRNCDYSKIGLQSTYRSMVENVKWYLGGYDNISIYVNDMYTYERGTTLPSSNAATSTGYIGLMYPSDYGYSVLASSCARDTYRLGSYGYEECAGKAWLLQNGYEWTITPNSSSTYGVLIVDGSGFVYTDWSEYGNAARPVLYLKSSTYIVSGDGTINNPYILMM